MARYLAIHNPAPDPTDQPAPPADLPGLARATGAARWLRTYTPDLHDDRHVSLWEADTAEDVRAAMAEYHFFVEAVTTVFRVHEWGPEDVLAVPTVE